MVKQKLLKFSTVFLFIFGISFHGVSPVFAQVEQVPTAGVYINGEVVNGIDPIKIDGVYYLPLIELSKILGYNHIKVEENTKTYEITDGSTKIRVTMGGHKAKKGNEYVNIKPPRWVHETPYVSLHASGALFNAYITFKKENGSIQIQKPAQQYVVHRKDTLFNISRIHHTTVNELKRINNLTSNLIKDGQVLKLPKADSLKGEVEPKKEQEPVKNNNQSSVKNQKDNIIKEAKKYIGAGYKFGATLAEAPKLFDCSSYTQLVYQNNGIQLPRVSRDQASKGKNVSNNNLQTGDLMFFTMKDTYSDGRVAHVGIYMGDGSMIHASTSKGVTITTNVLQNPYWSKNYLFSKRVIE